MSFYPCSSMRKRCPLCHDCLTGRETSSSTSQCPDSFNEPRALVAGVVAESSLDRRRKGVRMHVTRAPGERDFPAIRLNGKWLAHFGFRIGEEVIVKAEEGRITIMGNMTTRE